MEVNKLLFGGLTLGCLAAVGTGSYIAVRQNASPASETVRSAPEASDVAVPEAVGASGIEAVGASEGVITLAPLAVPQAPVGAQEPRTVPPPTSSSAPSSASATRTSRPSPAPRPARSTPPHAEAGASRAENRAKTNAPASSPTNGSGSMWESRSPVNPDMPGREAASSSPAGPSSAGSGEMETPARAEVVELVVPADSVLGLQVERTISSEFARVEDRVEARVTRDLRVGSRVVIPAGSVVQGSVTEVDTGGKVKERARLGVRFHTVVLADDTRLPVRTEAIVREGSSPTGESAAKIGGAAAGGAILGAILGGSRGAAIGGAIGAAGGTAATMAGDRNPAVLAQGSTVTVRIQQPVTVVLDK